MPCEGVRRVQRTSCKAGEEDKECGRRCWKGKGRRQEERWKGEERERGRRSQDHMISDPSMHATSAGQQNVAGANSKTGVPGATASTVDVHSSWQSLFRVLLQTEGSFQRFFNSIFRRPATPRDEGTASLWPMPLPYPEVFKSCQDGSDDDRSVRAFRLAINGAVFVLNWLFLRRPLVAPAEIVLGRPLKKAQWRVVIGTWNWLGEHAVVHLQWLQRIWVVLPAKWKTWKIWK